MITPQLQVHSNRNGAAIQSAPLSWDALVRLEPRLEALHTEAQGVRATGPHWCANACWYGYHDYAGRGLKPRLEALAGWGRRLRDPELMREYDAKVAAIEEKAGEWGIICLGDFPPLPPVIGCDGHPILCTSAAYDVAYRTIYELLPACRDCTCL